MMSYRNLIEYAKQRDMPFGKARGILREYLQILMLKKVFSLNLKIYFTGGTYLRLVRGTKRFSEDLDFYSPEMTEINFSKICEEVSKQLNQYGINGKLSCENRNKLFIGNFIFEDIEKKYGISKRKRMGLMIKIETAIPEWNIEYQPELINGYGETFVISALSETILMADKIDILHKKPRGRHIYDIIYLLSSGIRANQNILKLYGYKGNYLDILKKRIDILTENEIEIFAKQLEPFLFDENDIDRIRNCKFIINGLIKKQRE